MLREITKATGRYPVGGLHDFPRGVWNKIAADSKQKLDAFSRVVGIDSQHKALQSPLRGAPRAAPHVRLGGNSV